LATLGNKRKYLDLNAESVREVPDWRFAGRKEFIRLTVANAFSVKAQGIVFFPRVAKAQPWAGFRERFQRESAGMHTIASTPQQIRARFQR